jgi:hypothetical protein
VKWEFHHPDSNPLRHKTKDEILKLVTLLDDSRLNLFPETNENVMENIPTNFDPRDG